MTSTTKARIGMIALAIVTTLVLVVGFTYEQTGSPALAVTLAAMIAVAFYAALKSGTIFRAYIRDEGVAPRIPYPPPTRVERGLKIAAWAGFLIVLFPPLDLVGTFAALVPLLIVLPAWSMGERRERRATRDWLAERDLYRDRLARGLTVAEYWRDGVMQEARRELEVPYRTMAHPLACAISALTGEEHEPEQMGIEPAEFARRFPSTLEQLDELIRAEREGLPAEPAEPCWTGTVEGAICHRGGIGCPRPHEDDPDDLRRAEPRRLMAYDPLHPER
jgi:hypothetical protein